MLTLGEAQWRALQARDAQHFVAAVRDQFIATRPDVADSPGAAEVLARMQAAHDAARRIGLASTPHIVQWMYLVADGPGLIADPLVEAHLRKPGATPEQRLDDLLAVMKKKLEEAR